jgi:hypothetical protein
MVRARPPAVWSRAMSMHLDYESIAPLVSHLEVRLASLYVTFKCPSTGQHVISTARIGEMTPVGGDPGRSGDFERVRDALENGTRSLAGENDLPPFGAPHADLHDAAGKLLDKPEQLEEGVRRHGIVRAFESVSRRFRWEPAQHRWVMPR